jgi:hypothetical protein
VNSSGAKVNQLSLYHPPSPAEALAKAGIVCRSLGEGGHRLPCSYAKASVGEGRPCKQLNNYDS